MRKVIFGTANSLDNFIARPDGSVDWLVWGEEVAAITAAIWQQIDTMLIGRKTYEVMLRAGQTSYPGIKSYVFSRTLTQSPDPEVEIISHEAAAFVRQLKQQPGKEICVMAGGDLARTLFEAGLIDEIGFNIHPLLLGSGIPLFLDMKQQINLELLECRPLKNGCVYVYYRVRH